MKTQTHFLLLTIAVCFATGCSSTAPNFACADGDCGKVCSMLAAGCSDTEPCCPELVCRNGSCGPSCFTLGKSCSATEPCCTGLECGSTGVCVPPCSVQGGSCTGLGSCCTGFSCDADAGVCACLAEGDSCGATGEPCCAGTSCDGTGHCRAPCTLPVGACQPFGAACVADAGCCAPGSCQGGKCGEPSTAACALEGGPCATGSDCCGSVAYGSRPDCVPAIDGGNVCHLGVAGERCDNLSRHCTPGIVCVFPPDAGPPDSGTPDAGLDDGGVDDGGLGDAGDFDAGGFDAGGPIDAGPAVLPGVCTVTRTANVCTLFVAGCGVGDSCNPNSSTNQGYDPCFYKVVGQNLGYRSPILLCGSNGVCSQPSQGDPCTNTCIQTPGDSRRTSCLGAYDGSKTCVPACGSDADCRTASYYDGNNNNAQTVTNYCVNYSGGAGCQPALCFVEGQTGADHPAVLYKACPGRANTLCLPRYVGSDTNIEGFCSAVRPGAASTVGQTCDPRAGREATSAICGSDAVCLAGECAAVCDASALGLHGTPVCSKDKTCVSPQGLDLISDYQFGGCSDPCDPFADLAHSGCVNSCGGPARRCEWVIGDPKVGTPRGYCAAALKTPLKAGKACVFGVVDPCEAGDYCLSNSAGGRTCAKLCDPTAAGGTPDACPPEQTCTAFSGFTQSGYCH